MVLLKINFGSFTRKWNAQGGKAKGAASDRRGGGGVSSFLPLIHAFSHGQLCSPLEMVRLLAGYGFDEQINGNGYKRKASKLNQTSLSTVRGTLYRIRGKLRIFVDFHM